jgi:hypothetical protein
MHVELSLHDRQMCGERETALNGCLYQETVPEREHPGALQRLERVGKVAV